MKRSHTSWVLAISVATLSLHGCAFTEKLRKEAQAIHSPNAPTPQPPSSSSGVAPGYLDIMNNLSTPDPARQADLFYEVEREYTRAPTTASTLRYAVALVTPGHPASSPNEGKRLLETLLATPERLTQDERTLASVLLHETNVRLKLESENRRLLATIDDRSRTQANSDKRIQAQIEENARLR
ncbi:MAG: hypothetical protein ABW171_06550, partial [Steroidobacter sp.]